MDFLQELAQRLFERRHQAVLVPFRNCSSPGFRPEAQDCHGTVDRWCRAHPSHKPTRGWFVLEGYPQPDICRFVAHSVVEDEQGRLFDPTPPLASRRYRFLKDELTDEEFMLLLSARQLVHVDHCL